MGFEPMTSVMPVQCSTNWAMRPHWKQVKSEFNLYPSYSMKRVRLCEWDGKVQRTRSFLKNLSLLQCSSETCEHKNKFRTPSELIQGWELVCPTGNSLSICAWVAENFTQDLDLPLTPHSCIHSTSSSSSLKYELGTILRFFAPLVDAKDAPLCPPWDWDAAMFAHSSITELRLKSYGSSPWSSSSTSSSSSSLWQEIKCGGKKTAFVQRFSCGD